MTSANEVTEKLEALNVCGDSARDQRGADDPRAVRAAKRAKQKAENVARAEQAKEQVNQKTRMKEHLLM